MTFRILHALALTATLLTGSYAFAQDAVTPTPFNSTAYALDAETLSGGGRTIALWGIEAATARGTPENLRARAFLDDNISERQVRCTPMGGVAGTTTVRAQCLNFQERDLALMAIVAGQAVVNRRDMQGSTLSSAYLAAERQARVNRVGIWGAGENISAPRSFISFDTELSEAPLWVFFCALLLPLLGFLMLALIMQSGFRQLIALQKYQIMGTQKREKQLKEREKFVIAAALEGEINTNRAKLDAFLIIYEEMLKSLRDPSKSPKYKRAGDIIHDQPALARSVYDSNLDKLDLLGPQISSDLNKLYAQIDPNPDFRTLEPEMPVEKASELVDRIVRNAERMIEPMDKISGALNVIVRDRRSIGND